MAAVRLTCSHRLILQRARTLRRVRRHPRRGSTASEPFPLHCRRLRQRLRIHTPNTFVSQPRNRARLRCAEFQDTRSVFTMIGWPVKQRRRFEQERPRSAVPLVAQRAIIMGAMTKRAALAKTAWTAMLAKHRRSWPEWAELERRVGGRDFVMHSVGPRRFIFSDASGNAPPLSRQIVPRGAPVREIAAPFPAWIAALVGTDCVDAGD